MLVTGDISNGANDRPQFNRKEINVSSVLADIAPEVKFSVLDTLAANGSEENIHVATGKISSRSRFCVKPHSGAPC